MTNEQNQINSPKIDNSETERLLHDETGNSFNDREEPTDNLNLSSPFTFHGLRILFVIATAQSLLVTGALYITTQIAQNVGGYSGFYIKALVLLAIGLVIMVLSVVALKKLVSSTYLATLTVLPLVPFVITVFSVSSLSYVSPNFPTNFLRYCLLGILGIGLLTIIMWVDIFVLHHINAKKMRKAVSGIACLAIGICLFAAVRLVTHAGANINNNNQQNSAINKIAFTVYQPSYVPPLYSLASGAYKGPVYMTVANEDSQNAPPYYQFPYKYNTSNTYPYYGPTGYDVYEYKATGNYNPPTSCGTTVGEIDSGAANSAPDLLDPSGSCTFIGRSTLGCNVYYDDKTYNADADNVPVDYAYTTLLRSYCQFGKTVVAIDTSVSLQAASTNPSPPDVTLTNMPAGFLSEPDILQIFNSLKPVNHSQLQAYQLRYYPAKVN